MYSTGYFDLGNEKLHYLATGNGKKVVVLFHGYGQDANLFLPLNTYLNTEYTLISIDLPLHGKSRWGETIFTKQLLVSLIKQIQTQYLVSKISLIGYSMGGRVCLTITELMPECIDKMVLLAPDGLVFNWAYYLATSNYVGKKIFLQIIRKPNGFINLANWLLKKKLIASSKHKLITRYLLTDTDKALLLSVWAGMAAIIPNLRKLKAIIKQNKIPVFIFMGKFDKIIPASHALKFKNGLDTVQLHILQKGHKLLDHTTAAQIAQCLL